MGQRFDRIWHNARLATVREDQPGLGATERGVIAAQGGRIAFAGALSDFSPGADAAERIDCEGRWITPGLVAPVSSLGVVEVGAVTDTRDASARSSNGIAAAFRVWDAINPNWPERK